MKHENVVELYDYTENEKEIVLLMEYCNSANYFEEKLEEVSNIPIRTHTYTLGQKQNKILQVSLRH
jgi:serine/threonine protein kinase